MIQVLKPGNTTKQISCPKCNALLSYTKVDIKVNFYYDRSDFNNYYNHTEYIECPECNYQITLASYIDGVKQ